MLWAYNALLPAARLAVRALAPFRPKLRAGLAGRRGALERLEALGRRAGGRLVWMHTSSVGEYEQARPIAALLRQHHADLEILHTFFSPSGHEFAHRLGEALHVEYLPEDTPAAARRALAALRPRALVFVKYDVWPNLVVEARRRGVPALLLDATLQPRSWSLRRPARPLYRDVYRRLEVISTVSEADAARFRHLVPGHPGLFADGDTRFDQVLQRRRAARRVGLAAALACTPRPFTFVAGSTWGPDEARLLPAWRALRDGWRQETPPRLVLVPHEPTLPGLRRLETELRRVALSWRRYSDVETRGLDGAEVVVVDRVGILAELYELGDAAYVGGAFTTGVHSLLEPAVFGLPLLFGPRHHNAPEADGLLAARAAAVVRSATDLERELATLSGDTAARHARGERARAFVESNLGASERCFERLAACLAASARRAAC